ncbi:MAG TPA: DHH family phosphoesterase [Candidatus Nanoarchaeia archaeon]|nr:DHH family phosphoesterase [Candidatus Nanoarchaeia archaeon]
MEKEKENNNFKEIYEKLIDSKKIIISLHKGPDGDSLGSCSAMKYFLEKQNKNIKIISPDEIAESFLNLNMTKDIETGKSLENFNIKEYDVVLCLDSAKPSQIKTPEEHLKKGFVINIDHHETNPFYGNLNYIDSEKSSTCSILLDFFNELGIEIDKELATRLILGVYTDSRGFTARNAIQALKDANKLIDKQANYLELLEKIKISLRMKKYLSYIINNVQYKDNIAWSFLPKEKIKELDLNLSEIRKGISELRELKEFDIVFTLSEIKPGKIKVSFRSSKTDVSKFARELGGGGHKGAASADIHNMNLEQAKNKVLETIENYKNQ